MFGNKKPVDDLSASSAGSNALNSLVYGTTVDGNVFCDTDIRVDGTINGNLYCKAKVILGANGRVMGEIQCVQAVIEGHVEGKLIVEDLLTLKEAAHVVADIQTGRLSVMAGAYFNAHCRMTNGEAVEESPKKTSVPAALKGLKAK
jgi:cytoskeletal protein CcmA (bactofilin family)